MTASRFIWGILLVLCLGRPAGSYAQIGNPIRRLLRQDSSAAVRAIYQQPRTYRLQIYYTRVRRNRRGHPRFRTFSYRGQPDEYFYPASSVKLPAAALALEKLHHLPGGISRETPLRIDSAFAGQTRVVLDSTAPGMRPTIGQYIRKILLVSDNDAFNRLYEFVGQQSMNQAIQQRTSRRTRILHRLSVGDQELGSRHTNPFVFFKDSAGQVVKYQQPAGYNKSPLPRLLAKHVQVGKAYLDGEQRIEKPLDFSFKNFFPLQDQQQVLRALLYPNAVPTRQRFRLTSDDYAFLRCYLHLLPRQARFPHYDSLHFPDNYAKFLMAGPAGVPAGVRIYNKIGQAYGFLIDNACIVDSTNGVEFLLAAVVYVNHDEVLNDDQYDYEILGFPFLQRLGQLLYTWEASRARSRQQVSAMRAYWHPRFEQSQP